jgi:hypothetical protein
LRPSEKAALEARAAKSKVSLAEFLRTMSTIEMHADNPYSAEAYLRMQAAESRELERRERARA